MSRFHLTAVEVAKKIDWPLKTWPGNCFGVASRLVSENIVKGTAVYGHWNGPVAPSSMFHGKPIINHGWVRMEDGTVVDPTRYVFEGVAPYIWTGNERDVCESGFENPDPLDWECVNCGCTPEEHKSWPYDEGGNQLRRAFMSPPPDFDPKDKAIPWKLKGQARVVVDILFDRAKRKAGVLSRRQAFWLANVPYDMFTPVASANFAPVVYAALKRAGMQVAVPIDNWRMAERAAKENKR